jgi:hypothetical protein
VNTGSTYPPYQLAHSLRGLSPTRWHRSQGSTHRTGEATTSSDSVVSTGTPDDRRPGTVSIGRPTRDKTVTGPRDSGHGRGGKVKIHVPGITGPREDLAGDAPAPDDASSLTAPNINKTHVSLPESSPRDSMTNVISSSISEVREGTSQDQSSTGTYLGLSSSPRPGITPVEEPPPRGFQIDRQAAILLLSKLIETPTAPTPELLSAQNSQNSGFVLTRSSAADLRGIVQATPTPAASTTNLQSTVPTAQQPWAFGSYWASPTTSEAEQGRALSTPSIESVTPENITPPLTFVRVASSGTGNQAVAMSSHAQNLDVPEGSSASMFPSTPQNPTSGSSSQSIGLSLKTQNDLAELSPSLSDTLANDSFTTPRTGVPPVAQNKLQRSTDPASDIRGKSLDTPSSAALKAAANVIWSRQNDRRGTGRLRVLAPKASSGHLSGTAYPLPFPNATGSIGPADGDSNTTDRPSDSDNGVKPKAKRPAPPKGKGAGGESSGTVHKPSYSPPRTRKASKAAPMAPNTWDSQPMKKRRLL